MYIDDKYITYISNMYIVFKRFNCIEIFFKVNNILHIIGTHMKKLLSLENF